MGIFEDSTQIKKLEDEIKVSRERINRLESIIKTTGG